MNSYKTVKERVKEPYAETVGDIVKNRHVSTYKTSDTISDILDRMHASNTPVGGVIDKSRKCIGMITEREITRGVFNCLALQQSSLCSKSVHNLKALDIMIPSPVFVKQETKVDAALSLVKLKGFRYLPVLTETKSLVGIVDARELYHHSYMKHEKLLNEKDVILSYFFGNEPFNTKASI